MEETGLHGPFGDAEDARHLTRGELLDVAQHDDNAMIVREAIERPLQRLDELAPGRAALQALSTVTARRWLLFEPPERRPPPRRRAHVVPRVVRADAEEERTEGCARLGPRDRPWEGHERLLHEDRLRRSWTRLNGAVAGEYTVFDEVLRVSASALQEAVGAMSEALAQLGGRGAERVDGALMEFYFEALAFTRLIEAFGTHSIFDVTREPGRMGGSRSSGSAVCVRNVLPAPFLKPRYAAARSTVLFSATLAPWNFYCDTLGLPNDTAWLDLAAPFHAEQLSVRIAGAISTLPTPSSFPCSHRAAHRDAV